MDDEFSPILTVDLPTLRDNAGHLSALVDGAEVAPVIKANAYGLGADKVAATLFRQAGIRTFFVATPEEAARLTFPGLDRSVRVYVLNGYVWHGDLAAAGEVAPVLNTPVKATRWQDEVAGPCALALDIGMNRLGLSLPEAISLAEGGLNPSLVEVILMHPSHTDDRRALENAAQLARFEENVQALRHLYPNARFSFANSGGVMLGLEASQQLVRPGIALYGGAPSGSLKDTLGCVATLTAPVLQIRHVPKGESVGYGGSWTASKDSTIAVLGIGYADGYLRALSNRGVASIRGHEVPVAGRVSMDLTLLDISDVEGVAIGDRAELFGPNISIDRLAGLAGTISYELLTAIGPRTKRVYSY